MPLMQAIKAWAESHVPEVLAARAGYDGQRATAP